MPNGPQVFLEDNPPRRRHKTKGATMARKRKRSHRRKTTHRKRSRALVLHRNRPAMAKRSRRRHHVRRRFTFARNPSLVGLAMQGVEDAAFITVGQVANRELLKLIPALPATWSAQMQSAVAVAVQAAGSVAVGYASRMVLSAERARFVLAGAMASALQNAVKIVVPSAAPMLGDYPGWMMGYARVGGYARMNGYARTPRVSGYGARALVASQPNVPVGDYATDAQGLTAQGF